jgi:hypothetical protein
MADLTEIGNNPENFDSHEAVPKGIKLFFGEKERAFFSAVGREITEGILQESFLLYRIDLQKTKTHKLYGEAKRKV